MSGVGIAYAILRSENGYDAHLMRSSSQSRQPRPSSRHRFTKLTNEQTILSKQSTSFLAYFVNVLVVGGGLDGLALVASKVATRLAGADGCAALSPRPTRTPGTSRSELGDGNHVRRCQHQGAHLRSAQIRTVARSAPMGSSHRSAVASTNFSQRLSRTPRTRPHGTTWLSVQPGQAMPR